MADFDADGVFDLAVAERDGAVSVFSRRLTREGAESTRFRLTQVWHLDPTDVDYHVIGVAAADVYGSDAPELILATDVGVKLFRGNGDYTFDDVTTRARITPSGRAVGVTLADFDADGLLDIYTLNQAPAHQGYTESERSNRLWLNRSGRFVEQADRFGVADAGASWVAAYADVTADGNADVLVANDTFRLDPGDHYAGNATTILERGDDLLPDVLYQAVPHAPRFEVLRSSEYSGRRSSMGLLVADFDGDAHPDVYLSDYGENKLFLSGAGELQEARKSPLSDTWRQDTECAGERDPVQCLLVSWGAALGDFDGDGNDDLVVVNGGTLPGLSAGQPLSAWRGTEKPGGFEAVDLGLPWLPGRGVCVADANDDGAVDLLVANREPGERGVRVLLSHSVARGFEVRLRGHVSNALGIGATVQVEYDDGTIDKHWHGADGTVHSFCPSPARFSRQQDPAAVEVRWPSGLVQRIEQPDASEPLVVEEPDVLTLSARVVRTPEGTVDVTLRPRNAEVDGAHTLECDGCAWMIDPALNDNGHVVGRFRVANADSDVDASAVVRARVDGQWLSVAPRVWHQKE